MAMANTLAYYDTETITVVKRFIVQAPVIRKKTRPRLSFQKLLTQCLNRETGCTFTKHFQNDFVVTTLLENWCSQNIIKKNYVDHFLRKCRTFVRT